MQSPGGPGGLDHAPLARAIANWCAEPIELGPPGSVVTPYVLGPNAVPVVTEPEKARARPELAVLSVMAHGQSEAGLAIATAALAAAAGLDPEQQRLHVDVILSSLNEAMRRSLEAMMKGGYEYQSEFARTYVAKGREEGRDEGLREGLQEGLLKAKAQDVIAVLEARGLEVPLDVRERVLGCTDLVELDRWIRRAAVVSDARELFAASAS